MAGEVAENLDAQRARLENRAVDSYFITIAGVVMTGIGTAAVIINDIPNQLEKYAAYPATVVSAAVCLYGIRRSLSARRALKA